MVEIRRDSLTGNFLDKTVIDTLVSDLGNKEDVESTVKKTLKKRFSDSEITSNRDQHHDNDNEKEGDDSYNYEISSTDRLLMLIGDRNEIQFANTDKRVPSRKEGDQTQPKKAREEEEEGLFGPPSSFSTHTNTSYMSYDKNKPLARRGSIKFDYDNVDYDNPLANYEEENEYYDSDYPDRPLKFDHVIGQESLQEEDHHLRSSTDPIYAQLLQYNMSSFQKEKEESDNEEREEEKEEEEEDEEEEENKQPQERSLRRKVRNLNLDNVNKKKEEKLKQQRKSL